MPVQDKPTKAVVSVVEMASMLDLSKSRLYSLMSNGIFPRFVVRVCPQSVDVDAGAFWLVVSASRWLDVPVDLPLERLEIENLVTVSMLFDKGTATPDVIAGRLPLVAGHPADAQEDRRG